MNRQEKEDIHIGEGHKPSNRFIAHMVVITKFINGILKFNRNNLILHQKH